MDWSGILSLTAQQLLSPVTFAFVLAALGLALHFGFVGLLNFGLAGFMAVGAYGYAISSLSFGWPWWAAMLFGMVGSAAFAMLIGIPTLRLRGDYLAIVTIASAEVVRLLITSVAFIETTGSADGLTEYQGSWRDANPIPSGNYGFGPWQYTANELWTLLFGVVAVTLCALLLWRLVRSPWGRVLKGIREDEDAVRALGKNVFAYKMQALIVGGVFAGLGGIVYVLPSSTNPAVFLPSLTFFIWTALLLGGAATVFGPLLGSVLFWVLNAFFGAILPALVDSGILGFISSQQASTIRFILVGVGLILLIAFRPQGILGDKREMSFVKN